MIMSFAECQLSTRLSTSAAAQSPCLFDPPTPPQLCYYSPPCGYSHDEHQPIGISAPVVNSVKAASQVIAPLADRLAIHQPRPAQQHLERHGNGEETGGRRCGVG